MSEAIKLFFFCLSHSSKKQKLHVFSTITITHRISRNCLHENFYTFFTKKKLSNEDLHDPQWKESGGKWGEFCGDIAWHQKPILFPLSPAPLVEIFIASQSQASDLTTGTIHELRKERHERESNSFPPVFHQDRKATSEKFRKFISIDFKKCQCVIKNRRIFPESDINNLLKLNRKHCTE